MIRYQMGDKKTSGYTHTHSVAPSDSKSRSEWFFPECCLWHLLHACVFNLSIFLLDLQHGNGKTLGFNGSSYSSLIKLYGTSTAGLGCKNHHKPIWLECYTFGESEFYVPQKGNRNSGKTVSQDQKTTTNKQCSHCYRLRSLYIRLFPNAISISTSPRKQK